ncbi:MAG: threonine aldolase [Ponticaulis sp.]|nr:threonine aldolase [Ponticaulis sp.]
MDFSSDTSAPADPTILQALLTANEGMAPSYGADALSARVKSQLTEIFEADLEVYLVSSGTAANALALSLICPSHGAVLCHEEAHIEKDERGAPEFFTGGGKLQLLPGEHARIDVAALQSALNARNAGFVHETPAMALSLTNLTESGAAYSISDIAELSGLAREHNLPVHLDGARFANALQALGASPAEMSWKAGVDILTCGATKNGAMGCEAIILFGDMRDRFFELQTRAKRAGHMPAKMRFLAAQMSAYLEDDLWLTLAGQANAAARELVAILASAGFDRFAHPVDGNEVFVYLPDQIFEDLTNRGLKAYRWLDGSVRFVCNWATSDLELSAFRRELTQITK